MRQIKLLTLVVFSLLCFTFSALGQNTLEQKYKLAQSYENAGKFEQAERLYEEIYKKDKSNYKYFAGLVKTLRAQSEYSEMLPLVQDRIKMSPNGELYILLGELYWRKGETESANEAWNNALSRFPSKSIFQATAQNQADLQLFGKAITTFKKAREHFDEPSLFSDNLSKLYIATGNYQDGLDEVINTLLRNGDLAKAQGRAYAFMTKEKANNYIDDQLKQISENKSDNLLIQELYSWFLRTTGKLDKAFDVIKRIDELRKSQGRTILYFANNARDDGQYSIALKAYSHIINQGKKNKHTPSALYGFTRTLEKKLRDKDEFTDEQIDEVISSYNKIIEDYPGTSHSSQAYYRKAEINYNLMKDYDAAQENLKTMMKKSKYANLLDDAANLLGEIYLSKGEIDNAAKISEEIVNSRSNSKEEKNIAKLRLANIQFYNGNIDSAKTLFSELAKITNSDIANDALKKIVLIDKNKDLISALKKFGKAEYLRYKDEYDEAIELYDEIIDVQQETDLAQRSYIEKAEIMRTNQKFEDITSILEKFIEKYPESIILDRAYLMLGDAYTDIRNPEKAEKFYTKILVEFPRSIYLEKARKKIRKIREKS